MIRSRRLRWLINAVVFQVGWLICVLGSNLAAAIAVFGLVALHLAIISQHPRREGLFIVLGSALGSLMDGLWFKLGLLATPEPFFGPVPLWLLALWALFLTTIGHSLAWLASIGRLTTLLAPVAGIIAYGAASQLGAIDLVSPGRALIAIGVGWMITLPLLVSWNRRWLPEVAP